MSTRAHIIVKRKGHSDHFVYHHFDGYLEGVGKELKEFIREVYIPGSPSMTQTSFCKQLEDWDPGYEYRCNKGIHGDEEYLYTVTLSENHITVSAEILYCSGEWKPEESYREEFQVLTPSEAPDLDFLTKVLCDMITDYLQSTEGKLALRQSILKFYEGGSM